MVQASTQQPNVIKKKKKKRYMIRKLRWVIKNRIALFQVYNISVKLIIIF